MSTQTIGLNEFKTKRLWNTSKEKQVSYIVTIRSKPAFRVIPMEQDGEEELEDTDIRYYDQPGFYKVGVSGKEFLQALRSIK